MTKVEITTKHKTQMIDVTNIVKESIIKSGIADGMCVVMTPHTTCSVIFFENQDDNLKRDFFEVLRARALDKNKHFTHVGENAAAHLKSAVLGASITVPFENATPILGSWQGIFFVEFDGAKDREIYIKVI